MKLELKKGRVAEVSGPQEYVQRFQKSLAIDENASNCAAEFAIGTSHLVPKDLKGNMWDYASLGNIHIAVGRNTSLGGVIASQLHLDTLISKGTVWLDNVCVQEKGELKITHPPTKPPPSVH
jgi:leucyl aminopeptidase (aminopeptidase T)